MTIVGQRLEKLKSAAWQSRPVRRGILFVRGLSLKQWLWLIFSGITIIATSFAVVIFYLQHQVSVQGTERAVMENSGLERALRLKEEVTSLEQSAIAKEYSPRLAEKIQNQLSDLFESENSTDGIMLLQRARLRFDAHLEVLNRSRTAPILLNETVTSTYQQTLEFDRLSSYEDLLAAVESYIELK